MGVSELVSTRADAGHPPLFFLLEKWISDALGISIPALRILPLIAGGGTVCLTYLLLQRCFSNAISAIGSLAFAVAPAQLLICQMARSYSLLQLSVLGLATISLSCTKPSRLILTLTFLLSSFAVYVHSSSLIWLPILGASLMLIDVRHWLTVLSILTGLLSYLPFWYFYQNANNVTKQGVIENEFSILSFLQLPSSLVLGRLVGDLPSWVSLTVSALVTYTLIVAVIESRNKQLARFFLLQLLLLVWCNIAAAMEGKSIVRTERYFAPLFPITAFVVANWVHWTAVKGKRLQVVSLVVICSLSLLGVYLYFGTPPFTQDSKILDYISGHRRDGEPVVLFSNHDARRLSFLYYFRNQQDVHVLLERQQDPLPTNSGSLWIVVSPDTQELQDSLLSRDDCRDFRVASEHKFRISRVLNLEKLDNPDK